MFIQTEVTPNPQTIKFLPESVVIAGGDTYDFKKGDDLSKSRIAQILFSIDGVQGVFLGSDFISVTKQEDTPWDILKPSIMAAIMDHFISGLPAVEGDSLVQETKNDEDEDPIHKQIREIIDTRVRPAVAQDGGDIVFKSFEDGIVYVQMQGACAGCPSSSQTLKSGIENMLRFYVPEVLEVQQV